MQLYVDLVMNIMGNEFDKNAKELVLAGEKSIHLFTPVLEVNFTVGTVRFWNSSLKNPQDLQLRLHNHDWRKTLRPHHRRKDSLR